MDNKDIPGLENYGGGHYVYVKKKYTNGKSKVHTISAIEHWKKDKKHQIPIRFNVKTKDGDLIKTRYVSEKKLVEMRDGKIHPFPYKDSNFDLWSCIYLNEKTVDTRKIKKPMDGNRNVIHKFIRKKDTFPLKKDKIRNRNK